MLYAEGGEDLVEGGRAAGEAASRDYRANRYHGVNDEYDENWNWAGAIRDLRVYFAIMQELSRAGQWPEWLPGDEFRAIRDRSAAERR